VARGIVLNRIKRTWHADVDAFIALTEHSIAKFVAAGLPEDRIHIKPNFCPDTGDSLERPSSSNLALFAGRLSAEKGGDVLIRAWAMTGLRGKAVLYIAGDGPQRAELERCCSELGLSKEEVRFTGRVSHDELLRLMTIARAVLVPSLWYEGFPMVAVEAMSHGRPVLASGIGGLGCTVRDGDNGLLAEAGDAAQLGRNLSFVFRSDELADRLGANARRTYLANYTPDLNFQLLMSVYRIAAARNAATAQRRSAVRLDDVEAFR
jgi:glycosyltransferase involved in cell wall biosynthesis